MSFNSLICSRYYYSVFLSFYFRRRPISYLIPTPQTPFPNPRPRPQFLNDTTRKKKKNKARNPILILNIRCQETIIVVTADVAQPATRKEPPRLRLWPISFQGSSGLFPSWFSSYPSWYSSSSPRAPRLLSPFRVAPFRLTSSWSLILIYLFFPEYCFILPLLRPASCCLAIRILSSAAWSLRLLFFLFIPFLFLSFLFILSYHPNFIHRMHYGQPSWAYLFSL
ncbi:hypothetical protein BJX76DRAFT_146646 [Aspergillus varians]